MEKRPDRLATYVLNGELERCVLKGSVMASEIGFLSNPVPQRARLFVLADLRRGDDPAVVASPCGGHGVVKGLAESVG